MPGRAVDAGSGLPFGAGWQISIGCLAETDGCANFFALSDVYVSIPLRLYVLRTVFGPAFLTDLRHLCREMT